MNQKLAATQKAAATERKNKQMKNKLYLLAVVTAALSLNITTGVGQVFTYAEVLNNRAIASSPRAKEEFPWLTRNTPDASTAALHPWSR